MLQQNTKTNKTRLYAFVGVFSAAAFLLQVIGTLTGLKVGGFLDVEISDLPALIIAFAYGPLAGVLTELIKNLLHCTMTSTGLVGELANFVVGCSFAVPAAIVYHMNKSKKTAKMSLVAGTLCMAVFGSAFNAIYLIPAFATLYGIPLDVIVGMGTAINPAITSVWTLALFSVAPLNLLKGVLISVPTMLLYKRISKILQNAAQGHRVPESRTEN